MQGPYVLLALFCEQAAIDENSQLWVREAFGLSIAAPGPPGEPLIQGKVHFSARLVGGGLDGTHAVSLRCDTAGVDLSQDVPFRGEAEDMPFDLLNWPVLLRTEAEGTHWFELAVDGAVLTRVPLRLLLESSLLGL